MNRLESSLLFLASHDSNTGAVKNSRVDVEYLYILLPYIKQFNGYCALCVRNCSFGVRKGEHHQLLRCMLYCAGRPICPFTCSVIINNNGTSYIIVSNQTVRHQRGVKVSRPIRLPIRSILKEQFANGASVYRLYHDRLKTRTLNERAGNNYDVVGKSRNILRKIKSEGFVETLIATDVDQGVYNLCEQFQSEINVDGKVVGAIQSISKYPYKVIVFSENSIRLFDDLIKEKNVVLSWDATGSIIQERANKPRLLYYELSVTLPGLLTEDAIVPITFMISDAHGLFDIVQWLEAFKSNYKKVKWQLVPIEHDIDS